MPDSLGRLLYRGRSAHSDFEILVTTRWCVANGTRYRITDLGRPGLVRGRRDLRRRRKVVGLGAVGAVLVITIVAIQSGWTRSLGIALGITLLATAAVTMLPATVGFAMRRPYQIWALHEGRQVLLFQTEDSEQYGQVARALVRARELGEG